VALEDYLVPESEAQATVPNARTLVRNQGTPPRPLEDYLVPATEIVQPALDQQLRGYTAQVLEPAATRGRQPVGSERTMAQISAGREALAATGEITPTVQALEELHQFERMYPEASRHMGIDSRTLLDQAKSMIANVGRGSMKFLDVALSQLDRPRNAVVSAMLAAQEGRDWTKALHDGFFGMAGHRATSARTSSSSSKRVLEGRRRLRACHSTRACGRRHARDERTAPRNGLDEAD